MGKRIYYFVYTLLEYLTFAYFIWEGMTDKRIRKFILILSGLFTGFHIVFCSVTKIKRIDSVPIGVEMIVLMILIILFFYALFKEWNTGNIYYNPSFWLIMGILVYLGITFFFNILGDSLKRDYVQQYFHYSYLGDILKNIFFTVAVFFMAKGKFTERGKSVFSLPYLDMT